MLATVIEPAALAAATLKVVAIGALKFAIGAPKMRLLEACPTLAFAAVPFVALGALFGGIAVGFIATAAAG